MFLLSNEYFLKPTFYRGAHHVRIFVYVGLYFGIFMTLKLRSAKKVQVDTNFNYFFKIL